MPEAIMKKQGCLATLIAILLLPFVVIAELVKKYR